MNKEWTELHKIMQSQLTKESTYAAGIEILFNLRQKLYHELLNMKIELKREEFDAIPFINADGYHSKTIAYSIWHIFRIEDIVAHSLINSDEQIFFVKDYKKRINSPIITTGNELNKQEISIFSNKLNIDELYQYAADVKNSTECIIEGLSCSDMKRRITDSEKEYLKSLKVVSMDENAYWLIDYWCGKNLRELIKMPFSRHWIMHIEACLRIVNKIRQPK